MQHWNHTEGNEDTIPRWLNGNSKGQRDFVLPVHISLSFLLIFPTKTSSTIFSIQEVGNSLPAAPKIPSQSKESGGAGADKQERKT